MADPFYGAAPRQESTVVRTNDEFEAMRRAKAKQISETAKRKRDAARADNPYWQHIENIRQNAPSTIELQYYTGATPEQAQRIIQQYGDWANYAPEGGFGQHDLEFYQNAVNAPDWATKAPDFQWQWSDSSNGGQIVPYYLDQGEGPSSNRFMFIPSNGEQGVFGAIGGAGLADKQRFYEDARGLGFSDADLDAFARQAGAGNWATLNFNRNLARNGDMYAGGRVGEGGYRGIAGNPNHIRGNPELWGGSYILGGRASGFDDGPHLINPTDGSSTTIRGMPGSTAMYWNAQQDFFDINDQYRQAHAPIGAMNRDFAANMAKRDESRIRTEQGYDALTGYGNGGLLDQNYSNPFFGQITGREAAQSPFSTPEQKYPWSLPTEQLDLASLMSPGYGGPNGSGTMGAYGGSGWGQGFGGGQNKFGGMGGLGGFQAGPFGAKNPWSPS